MKPRAATAPITASGRTRPSPTKRSKKSGTSEIGLLPDYEVSFDDVADKVIFSPRDGGTTLRKRIAEAERRGLRTLESMLSVAIGGVAIAAHLIR